MDAQTNPKILVADDDENIVEAIKAILESRSYTVVTAYNKEQALERAGDSEPDLIILDVMMSHITDGFEVARKLRADHQTHKIPIIILTAIHQELDKKLSPGIIRYSPETDGEYLPVDDFVDKPIHPDDLIERVERLLGRKSVPQSETN